MGKRVSDLEQKIFDWIRNEAIELRTTAEEAVIELQLYSPPRVFDVKDKDIETSEQVAPFHQIMSFTDLIRDVGHIQPKKSRSDNQYQLGLVNQERS